MRSQKYDCMYDHSSISCLPEGVSAESECVSDYLLNQSLLYNVTTNAKTLLKHAAAVFISCYPQTVLSDNLKKFL